MEGLLLRLAPQAFQQPKHGQCPLLADGGSAPAFVPGEGKADLGMEPGPRREHGPNGIIKGAEIPLPEEGGQTKLMGGEHGRIVQKPGHGLELGFVPGLYGQDDALGHFVPPAKGDLHPVAGQKRHICRNSIGIGLVNGENRRRNSNFSDHKPSE